MSNSGALSRSGVKPRWLAKPAERSVLLVLATIAVSILCFPGNGRSWGYRAHEEIHRHAIQALPDDIRPFFQRHARELIERSVEADKRRFGDPSEGFFHYINLDRYGSLPFPELPRDYTAAGKKFGKTTVDTNGTVPWRIADFTRELARAIGQRDTAAMIFFAANLGHYVADAHVPLHATENYDGQLTGQKGLHARWESRLPEKFGTSYALDIRKARVIADPLEHAFTIVLTSFSKVDSVLSADREAIASLAELARTSRRKEGRETFIYSPSYFTRFHDLMNGMIERRMEDSIHEVASYWLTAWRISEER